MISGASLEMMALRNALIAIPGSKTGPDLLIILKTDAAKNSMTAWRENMMIGILGISNRAGNAVFVIQSFSPKPPT
jgi:hypothetical protein